MATRYSFERQNSTFKKLHDYSFLCLQRKIKKTQVRSYLQIIMNSNLNKKVTVFQVTYHNMHNITYKQNLLAKRKRIKISTNMKIKSILKTFESNNSRAEKDKVY